MVVAMPGTMIAAWIATAGIGVLADFAVERSGGSGTGIMLVYGVAITFVQVWVTRAGFAQDGIDARLPIANSLSVYLQGILVGLGTLLGFVLLILPGLYVFARWYLAGTLLVRNGNGRTASMRQSWDLLETHWPAALGVGLILFLLSAGPIAIDIAAPALAAEYGFAWVVSTNLISSIGLVGSYLAAVALLLNIEQPASTLQEIFG